MDTAEMRLLTVPQFARRVSRSVDEVLALIANRDVKALRPDPEGGYRVLETEVDRLLQEKTRIKRPVKAESAPRPSVLEPPTIHRVPSAPGPDLEPTPARNVPMETHLTVVTALETAKADNARLARLSTTLQAELFQYRQLLEQNTVELTELRTRLEAASQGMYAARLEKIELERERVEMEQAQAKRLQAELEQARAAEAAKSAPPQKKWWQRLFG